MGTDPLTRLYSKEPLGFAVMQITLGYFTADLLVRLSDKMLRGDTAVIIHHLVAATAVVITLYNQGRMMYFLVVFYITELPTPFVNFWRILRLTGNKNSYWRALASFGLWTSFFLCRVAPIPWHWYVALNSIMHPAAAVDALVGSGRKCLVVAIYVSLDALTIYWFCRMCIGALKKLRRLGKKA